MTDPIVRVSGVSKRYLIYDRPQDRLWQGLFRGRRQFFREFWALQPTSFEVQRGETVGIIGANGSGKSTLLQMVCGTLQPTTGSVQVTGRLAALLELGSGFNPEFTGRENVFMNGTILGLSRAQIAERFDDIAAFADIGEFIDQPVKTYSSGMTVRLAFSVIAHVDADLLVIDEALAVGDALFTQKCMRFLRRFQERGAILFVSHDTGAVLNLCQRALWLRHGTCVEHGPAKAVVQAYMRANIEAAQRADGLPGPTAGEQRPSSASPASQASATSSPSSPSAPPGTAQVSQPSPTAAAESAVQGTRATGGDGASDSATAGTADALFDPAAPSFGANGATIQSVDIRNSDGVATTALHGGERVTLRVGFRALAPLESPIIGFHVKDRLGQVLFGENTCAVSDDAPTPLQAGETATAEFAFAMPSLRTGKYTLDIAVADGTLTQHVQHQWFFDAMVIHVLTDRPVSGVLALPACDIRLAAESAATSTSTTTPAGSGRPTGTVR